MADSVGEKTEAPTSKRRSEARESGNVARSMDFTAALTLLGAILLLYFMGMRVMTGMRMGLVTFLNGSHAGNLTRMDDLPAMVSYAGEMLTRTVLPLIVAVTAIALLATVGQVGFMATGKPLVPSFKKLDPIKGVKNLFNLRAGIRFVMSLGKLLLIGGVCGYVIYRDLPVLAALAEMAPSQAFAAGAYLVFMLALKLAVVLLVLAILDLAYQVWQREQDLKMSKQDVKDEMKSMDGDPMVKQRRARIARQLALQRTAAAVPGADVIVTNPTHFSVALKYDKDKMRAPKVVAKGSDFLALRIRQIAQLNDVPIIERKPLARALYANVEVGQEVPSEHYAAVAEVLAFVYRVSRRAA